MKQLSLPFTISDPLKVFRYIRKLGYLSGYSDERGIKWANEILREYQHWFTYDGKCFAFRYTDDKSFKPVIVCSEDEIPKGAEIRRR